MRVRSLVLVGVLTMSVAGCGVGIKAASDFDKRVDFGNYGTFFMLKGNSTGDARIDESLASDIGSALESKGWAEVPEGEGKAVVIVHTATGAEHTYTSFYNGWGGWRWQPFDEPAPFPEDYKAGTVVVTIFDADTRQAIWRGFAADAISDGAKQTTRVHERALTKMFAEFPPAQSAVTQGAVRTSPPTFLFSTSPAVLVPVDGDPVYRNVEGTALRRVVNTKMLIVRSELGTHYMRIGGGWMQAYVLSSWWEVTKTPPDGADVALKQAIAAKGVDLLDGRTSGVGGLSLTDAPPPVVFVSTTPAILIVTDGPLRFASVPGTSLEYVANTSAKVFREPTDQELYVLADGRWYRSWKTEGPWQSIPAGDLPADFGKIPGSLLNPNVGGLE